MEAGSPMFFFLPEFHLQLNATLNVGANQRSPQGPMQIPIDTPDLVQTTVHCRGGSTCTCENVDAAVKVCKSQ